MANPTGKEPPNLQAVAGKIAEALSADLLIYTGLVDEGGYERVEQLCERRTTPRNNVVLILSTVGGEPHAAFRIARCLGRYSRFTVFAPTKCKSAGTLICVGADELVMWSTGELGPLDVQLLKRDEIDEQTSGLDLMATLEYLEERAIAAFDKYLRTIKARARAVSTATAARMATSLTVGLYSEIFKRLDPVHLGEVSRAMGVAMEYGERLSWRGKNLDMPVKKALDYLVAGYSSHAFVVDRDEASAFFKALRAPNDGERALLRIIEERIRDVSGDAFVEWVDELPEYETAGEDAFREIHVARQPDTPVGPTQPGEEPPASTPPASMPGPQAPESSEVPLPPNLPPAAVA